jgi:hypothetical protein
MKTRTLLVSVISTLFISIAALAQPFGTWNLDARDLCGHLRVLGKARSGSKGEGIFERIQIEGIVFDKGMTMKEFDKRRYLVEPLSDCIFCAGELATDERVRIFSMVTRRNEEINFHFIFREKRLTKIVVDDLFVSPHLLRLLSLPPESEPLSLEEKAGVSSSRWEDIEGSDDLWDQVKRSNNIVVFDRFIKANLNSEHLPEMQRLISAFFRSIIDAGRKAGWKVIKSRSYIGEVNCALNMSTMGIGGGRLVWGQHNETVFYSDPLNKLAIDPQEGIRYLQGRGLIITSGKIYTFGLDK